MSLYEILNAVRSTSSKLEKRAILEENKDNELLREFLKATYDPRIQYNIKKLPKAAEKVVLTPREFDMDDLDDMLDIAKSNIRGKAAQLIIAGKLASLNDDGKELLSMLIARDVSAGMAENSILEVWPGLFFIPPYQRCAKLDEKTKAKFAAKRGFYVQTKSDGQFCYAIKDRGDTISAMSRAGSLYPRWVAEAITRGLPHGHVAMGELLVYRCDKLLSRKDGNGILNSILSGDGSKFNRVTDEVEFVAWDMVTDTEFLNGESTSPYKERWLNLLEQTNVKTIPCWWVESLKDANRIQQEHLARHEEGTVWKDADMGWRDCQSGDPDMVKAKLVFQADFEIEGAYVHKKNPKMLGGFNVKTRDGLIKFDVGSGFSDDQRLDYWRRFNFDPEVFNGMVATLEGNDIVTSKGKTTESLFLPIFCELRLDKKVADSRQEVWDEFNAAKQGRSVADA